MRTLWLDQLLTYDGSQLCSLYAYMNHGLQGDSVVAWRGPCNIPPDKMVDGEDLRAKAVIAGSDMVHFVVEMFHQSLVSGVLLQRLFAAIVAEEVEQWGTVRQPNTSVRFTRSGDDLFWEDRKFSISIATVSPVSALVHFAFNIRNAGTPVSTCALEDFWDPKWNATQQSQEVQALVQRIAARLAGEWDDVLGATCKVRWVT